MYFYSRDYQSPAMKALGVVPVCYKQQRKLSSQRFWLWMVYAIVLPRVGRRCLDWIKEESRNVRYEMDGRIHNRKDDDDDSVSCGNRKVEILRRRRMRRRGMINLAKLRRQKVRSVVLHLCPMLRLLFLSMYMMGFTNAPTIPMFLAGVSFKQQTGDVPSVPTMSYSDGPIINFVYLHKRLLYVQVLRTIASFLAFFFFITPSTDYEDLATFGNGYSMLFPDDLQGAVLKRVEASVARFKEILSKMLLEKNKMINKAKCRYSGFINLIRNNETDLINETSLSEIDLECVICKKPSAFIPYQSDPCKHIFCYACLRLALIDNVAYTCEKCGAVIKSSRPIC